ncbi:MAG: YcaQ family DNA glycosylase [Gammaproteobacteria bacterium]|nr:YcaQ family DNA glycosylase [Gammaproteobacteria bacterium]MBL4729222.1 YcaQ family DNA glycosylase [Gammaproteobacteria bacterium]
MIESISPSDARRLVLARQGLASRRTFGSGLGATQKVIEHLGYVQIDTLSVVARAHIHTLWNRVSAFKATDIDLLQEQGAVFEHWAHALAILPMRDYRYSLPMMQRIASGDTHWYPKDRKQVRRVLKRIREEGPLSAKDFKDKKSSDAMWARSPSKIALEQLFMEGELMVSRRNNFHKVYDLRERVLPSNVDVSTPTVEELCGHLIGNYLRSHGLAQIAELTYLRKGLGKQMSQTVADLVEAGMLLALEVNGQTYYATPKSLDLIEQGLPKPNLRILSPFDNAVIQRKRLASLFGFDYQIECYVPKAKRKYGYFCLPILRGNRFVARLDAKADRKTGVFHVMNLYLERSVRSRETFLTALRAELERFAKFDGCTTVEIHSIKQAE